MSEGVNGNSMSVELANMRGDMNTGFAKLEGQLGLLVQADAQRRRDIDDLESRVVALEARRWPIGPMAVVSGVVSAAVATAAFLVQ